jgi:putative ABC transport system substrate-binding protein
VPAVTQKFHLSPCAKFRNHFFPASFSNRNFVEAGGLMSYGTNIADSFRQAGVYTGQILKGAKPPISRSCSRPNSNLPSTSRPQRVLGIDVPTSLLAIADEVIE